MLRAWASPVGIGNAVCFKVHAEPVFEHARDRGAEQPDEKRLADARPVAGEDSLPLLLSQVVQVTLTALFDLLRELRFGHRVRSDLPKDTDAKLLLQHTSFILLITIHG